MSTTELFFKDIIRQIQFDPWAIVLGKDGDRYYLQVQSDEGICNVTGAPMSWKGRKWPLSPHMTETEVVNTAFLAVLGAMQHEVCEKFFYKGVTVYDPHIRIEDRVAIRKTKPLDARKEP